MKRILFSFFAAGLIVACSRPTKDQSQPYSVECSTGKCGMHDYQIELFMDTMWVYDHDRLVGTHVVIDSNRWQHGAWLDTLLLQDNE